MKENKLILALTRLSVGMALVAPAFAATVIYDSSSMYPVGTTQSQSQSGWNNNVVTHTTEAYWAQRSGEIGGKIGFAGTERLAQSAIVQMRTGSTASGAVAGPVTLSLNFYGIDGSGLLGGLLGSTTQTFASPAGTDDPLTPYVNEGRPFYNATFDLTSLGLVLPDQVYFGVALSNPGSNSTTQSTNLSLWSYGTYPGWSTLDSDFDGSSIKVGTDLSNSVWSRSLNDDLEVPGYSGFTPNLIVNATNATVPETGTSIALLGIGLACLTGLRRSKA